jgi:hypothetical protein
MDNTLHTAFIVALEVYPREGFNQIVWKQVQEFTNTFRAKIEANIENQPTREQASSGAFEQCFGTHFLPNLLVNMCMLFSSRMCCKGLDYASFLGCSVEK